MPRKLHLRSKVAQLADYLRSSIVLDRLAEPLPPIRAWSQQLGVSRRTLGAALLELRAQGLVVAKPRGMGLGPKPANRPHRGGERKRVLMLMGILYRPRIHHYFELFRAFDDAMALRGFDFKWELCAPNRLREIASQQTANPELVILHSLPLRIQAMFARSARPAVVLGHLGSNIALPYIDADLPGVVRHAAFTLLRHGAENLYLIGPTHSAPGDEQTLIAFRVACAAWSRTVTARAISTAVDQRSLVATVQRLTSGIKGRNGFIVMAPVPVAMVMTALLQHGIEVPHQVELVSVFHEPESIKLYPPPIFYPSPNRQIVRHFVNVAEHFFETGRVLPVAKTLAVEVVRPQ